MSSRSNRKLVNLLILAAAMVSTNLSLLGGSAPPALEPLTDFDLTRETARPTDHPAGGGPDAPVRAAMNAASAESKREMIAVSTAAAALAAAAKQSPIQIR